jgi:hypothetical protein
MAGNYVDYPSYRMPYDRDGTQVYKITSSNVITAVSAANILIMNNENSDSYAPGGYSNLDKIAFIFPELRDLDGYFIIGPSTIQAATSADTTNGVDGTWTNLGASTSPTVGVIPGFRTSINTSAAAAGIKAIRFAFTGYEDINGLHLFGKITAGQNPNRLILWHPTLDQRAGAAYFDWGDVRRSAAATDRTFRVKNNSSTLTANGVSVSFDVLSDASPTLLAGQHSLSLDGTTFTNTVTIGALAPGAISGTVTVRRTMSATAALSLWALRVVSSATSWT